MRIRRTVKYSRRFSFFSGFRPNDVTEMIDEGVMIGSGQREAAEIGRNYTKRKRPW